MPNEIDRTSSAQRRSSELLTAMAIFICLGIAAYMAVSYTHLDVYKRQP